MANSEGVIIQSLARAFEILDFFQEESEMGISNIAEKMGLSKSTVYGLVNTLVKYNYLEQDDITKKYRLGLKLFEMGTIVESRMDIRREANSYCNMLSEKYGLTVHLATHYEGEVVYLEKYAQRDFIIVYSQVGKRAPMTCTGVGKAMLAYLDQDYIDRYILSKPFPVKTVNSISNERQLTKSLVSVRKTGYALDDEEIALGLKCVAAPIFKQGGKVIAAISVSAMKSSIDEEEFNSIAEDVVMCANEISARFGYRK